MQIPHLRREDQADLIALCVRSARTEHGEQISRRSVHSLVY